MSHALYSLLTFLDEECLLYHLDHAPPDAITVSLSLAGERVEITVFEDERVEFIRFTGDNNIGHSCAPVARLYESLRRDGLN